MSAPQGPSSARRVRGLRANASAATAVVRAMLVRRPVLIGVTAVGLLAIVAAGLSGARFVGNGDNASSMTIAIAAGVAFGAYAVVLFFSGSPQMPARP